MIKAGNSVARTTNHATWSGIGKILHEGHTSHSLGSRQTAMNNAALNVICTYYTGPDIRKAEVR